MFVLKKLYFNICLLMILTCLNNSEKQKCCKQINSPIVVGICHVSDDIFWPTIETISGQIHGNTARGRLGHCCPETRKHEIALINLK